MPKTNGNTQRFTQLRSLMFFACLVWSAGPAIQMISEALFPVMPVTGIPPGHQGGAGHDAVQIGAVLKGQPVTTRALQALQLDKPGIAITGL